jgi:hypothetical protein
LNRRQWAKLRLIKKRPELEIKKRPEVEIKKCPEVEIKKRPELEIKKRPEVEIKKRPELEMALTELLPTSSSRGSSRGRRNKTVRCVVNAHVRIL